MPRPGREVIPAAPFARWLNQRVEYWTFRLDYSGTGGTGLPPGEFGPSMRVCHELGWGDESGVRRLHRMRNQISESRRGRVQRLGVKGELVLRYAEWFERNIVEEALFHAGVAFEDLYPEIAAAEDLVLEPDAWCPGCRESRTPIDGLCPFCEWRLGPPTGQVLQGRRLVA